MRRIPWLLVLSLLAPAATAAEPPEIVRRAIAHHGGERYTASETELDVCSRSGCFHVIARVDAGSFVYDVRGEVDGAERRVRMTNGSVEMWVDGVAVEVAPADAQKRRDWAMARVYFCFLPYRLNDPSVRHRDRGLEVWDGRTLHMVEVRFTPGSSTDADDAFLYGFDPETGRLEQFAYSFETGDGGLRFRRLFNYRRVGGILFFDQENWGLNGREHGIEDLTPDFVAAELRLLSTVRLENIEVRVVAGSEGSG